MYDCSDVDDDCFENWFDCAGECAGTAQELTYCFDSDGDGFGQPGTETVYCDASLEDGWVLDCSDLNDDIFCENNIFDECFVCDPCGDTSDDCIEWDQLCNEPVAFNGAYQISEDEFITILLEADDPNDDLLSYQITQAPINGLLSGQNNIYLYTPNQDFLARILLNLPHLTKSVHLMKLQ